MTEVAVLYKSLPHYRVDFYERLKDRLATTGVRFRLLVGQPDSDMAQRNDTGAIAWAEQVRNRYIRIGSRHVVWQPCLRTVRSCDLVIVEQASKLLVNYLLLGWRLLGGPRVAWWGHGANLDRDKASSIGESVKRRLAKRADWWFCYTDGTAQIVRALGVPDDRLTVVQNAIDGEGLRRIRSELGDNEINATRREIGVMSGPVALCVGSLYPAKRPKFLLDAADLVRQALPGFQLLVVGDGPEMPRIKDAARTRPWIHVLGMHTGRDLARYAALASVILNPGLVGLSILDSFALEIPLITTAVDYHSPEVEYLVNGENGLIVSDPTSVGDYSEQIVAVLTDSEQLASLRAGCRLANSFYTIDAMVARFADGIERALTTPSVPSRTRQRFGSVI